MKAVMIQVDTYLKGTFIRNFNHNIQLRLVIILKKFNKGSTYQKKKSAKSLAMY